MNSRPQRNRRAGHTIGAALFVAVSVGDLAFAAPALAAATTPETQRIAVTLDRAKLIKMPEHVDTIVVGSPIIADVTMLKKNGLVVITGKGYGETNMIFLDAGGQALSEALISVQRPTTLVTVQRGADRESYSCQPVCEPTIVLGDAKEFLQNATNQVSTRNGLAAPTR